MKIKNAVIGVVLCCTLIACGEKKLNMSIDSNSVAEITDAMPLQERISFLADMKLIIALRGGDDYCLNGYTVNEVRNEAKLGRQFVQEKNAEFLRPVIQAMEKNGGNPKRLHVNAAGLFSMPEPGYIDKSYSLAQLKSIVDQHEHKVALTKDGERKGNASAPQKANVPQITPDSPGENLAGGTPDANSNAEPNGEEEAKNRLLKKPWQDKNGFMHYPDGSVSDGPVD